ncbi:MAG: DUF4962 domain-containing protein [Planctomycetes bacterium]|nr:DUF4962 domain-containing protein [Planctomycetota bacterium]
MKLRSVVTLIAATLLVLSATPVRAAEQAGGGVDYEGNLAKVPAEDPAATDAPQVVEAMKGHHPRLWFTAEEAAALKARAADDPILKQAYDDVTGGAKRFKLKPEAKPAIVMGDTAALTTSAGNYPGLAMTYLLDGDPVAKQGIIDILTMMLEQPYWADTAELDSNMGAGNNMFMVGLLFDAVYNDLEPELQQKLARKILTHVRRMYYLGHKQLALMPIKYWQQDPANNHRWHRAAGMAACLLAIADVEGVDCGYVLQEFKKEMDFLVRWYPADGDCHEGAGYQTFGFFYLAAAARMMDRVLGTEYLKAPGFRNAWAQQLYYWAPGRRSFMTFGDAPNTNKTFGHLDAGFFICPALSRDKDVQAALVNYYQKNAKFDDPKRVYRAPWILLALYDPTVGQGDYKALPTYRLFADLGAASMRDSWDDDAVLFTFKCGPYGGYKLNEYRHEVKDDQGKPHYVNVAHDDPDANCFALGFGGELLFHPGNYATNKLTQTNNTITVDGKGQLGEGDAYTQPVPGVDMRTLSYLTGWKAGQDGRIIVEGEAGNAYPTLKRFRRTAVWMPGEYILILDDIRGDGAHTITWRGTSEKAQFEKPEDGRCYAYTKSGKRVDFQMLANKEFKGSIDYMMLAGRWTQLLMQQFQFHLDAESVKFACLLDPWKKKVGMTLNEDGDTVTLTVRGDTFEDVWTWQGAKDLTTPSRLAGTRDGKPLAALTEGDKAPQGDSH